MFWTSAFISSFISQWIWSQPLLNFQEFLKIIPADKNLSYFLVIYSLKMFPILWDLGLKEN